MYCELAAAGHAIKALLHDAARGAVLKRLLRRAADSERDWRGPARQSDPAAAGRRELPLRRRPPAE